MDCPLTTRYEPTANPEHDHDTKVFFPQELVNYYFEERELIRIGDEIESDAAPLCREWGLKVKN